MMVIQSTLRVFLVALAAVLCWRLGADPWALTAVAVVAVGWLLEAVLIARLSDALGVPIDRRVTQPDLRRLRSHDASVSCPLLLQSLAVLALTLWRLRPDIMGPQVGLALLALAHGTAFRVLRQATWPEAALAVSRAWGGPVRPAALARLLDAMTLVLPKRGLLTVGAPRIDQVEALDDETRPEDVLRAAAALLRPEASVLSRALQQAARRARLALPNAAEYELLPGLGRCAKLDEHRWYLGGRALAAYLGHPLPELEEETIRRQVAGGTMLLLFRDDQPLGRVALEDPLRPEALPLLAELRRAGVARLCVLTDDDPEAAEETRRRFQLDEVMPQVAEDMEAEVVRAWAQAGTVAVVARPGSATAALVAADVPIALLAPDEPVPDYAELAIRNDDPTTLPVAWQAARATLSREAANVRRTTLWLLAPLVAAVLALPLPWVVALDELVVLATIQGEIRRAK